MTLVPIVVGADPRTRAAIKQAFRDGHTSSPQVDLLLREWRRRWSLRRWLLPVAVGFNTIAVFLVEDGGARVLLGTGAFFMIVAIGRAEVSHRRLARYRGLIRSESAPGTEPQRPR